MTPLMITRSIVVFTSSSAAATAVFNAARAYSPASNILVQAFYAIGAFGLAAAIGEMVIVPVKQAFDNTVTALKNFFARV